MREKPQEIWTMKSFFRNILITSRAELMLIRDLETDQLLLMNKIKLNQQQILQMLRVLEPSITQVPTNLRRIRMKSLRLKIIHKI